MSKYTVTNAAMETTMRELKADNEEFRNRVVTLVNKQEELAAQWQGEANDAFKNAFNSDKGQWDKFAALVDQYAEAIGTIKNIYQTAETTNTGTAQTRSY